MFKVLHEQLFPCHCHYSVHLNEHPLTCLVHSVSWIWLQQRFERSSSECLSDIYDGDGYKKHASFLSEPSNVSLTLNTDGVSIYRSSNVDLWPVWFTINELPKNKR